MGQPAAMPIKTKFLYSGELSSICLIYIKNLMLNLLTLGIYSFWGRTKMRKYLWSHVSLLEKNLEYTGTGRELFYGFAKAAALLLIISVISSPLQLIILSYMAYLPGIVGISLLTGHGLISYFTFIYLCFVGIYMAQCYRLSRTQWCGISSKRTGSAIAFANKSAMYMLFNILTLGFFKPITDIKLARYMISRTYFGSMKYSFDEAATGKELYKLNFITWILAIPTLGISRFWYSAALNNYICSYTKLGDVSFAADYTGSKLMSFYLGNTLLILTTFGLATPFYLNNSMNFIVNNISLLGEIDISKVKQSDQELANSGEGLISALGSDIGF